MKCFQTEAHFAAGGGGRGREVKYSLNFETCRFAYWGEIHVAVDILLLYLRFSLSLSQFEPIFVSFVAISAVLCCFLKAMSLVSIYRTFLKLGDK